MKTIVRRCFGVEKNDKNMSEMSQGLGRRPQNKLKKLSVNRANEKYGVSKRTAPAVFNQCRMPNAARQQQMSSEQQIQTTLNQASTNLMDSERLEALYNSAAACYSPHSWAFRTSSLI